MVRAVEGMHVLSPVTFKDTTEKAAVCIPYCVINQTLLQFQRAQFRKAQQWQRYEVKLHSCVCNSKHSTDPSDEFCLHDCSINCNTKSRLISRQSATALFWG